MEGDYEIEMVAVDEMTKFAQNLLREGNYGSVWVQITCKELDGRQRDVKKWTLTPGTKPRVVDQFGAVHMDTGKGKRQ